MVDLQCLVYSSLGTVAVRNCSPPAAGWSGFGKTGAGLEIVVRFVDSEQVAVVR